MLPLQVKSIAECSKGSILQYFQPSLSYIFLLSIFEWPIYTGFTVSALSTYLIFCKILHLFKNSVGPVRIQTVFHAPPRGRQHIILNISHRFAHPLVCLSLIPVSLVWATSLQLLTRFQGNFIIFRIKNRYRCYGWMIFLGVTALS